MRKNRYYSVDCRTIPVDWAMSGGLAAAFPTGIAWNAAAMPGKVAPLFRPALRENQGVQGKARFIPIGVCSG
jgi:hypothetical protein